MKNEEPTFEVVERKITLATRVHDYFFAKKVRRNVKRNRTPEMKAYIAERKNPKPIRLVNPNSVEQKIKQHLLDGKSITTLECLRLFGSSELRHEIASLRKSMSISDEWFVTHTGKRVKRYYVSQTT